MAVKMHLCPKNMMFGQVNVFFTPVMVSVAKSFDAPIKVCLSLFQLCFIMIILFLLPGMSDL
jgi:hypothetical protein